MQSADENLVARSFFLDHQPGTSNASRRGLRTFIPALRPHYFVYLVMLMDFAGLMALSASMNLSTFFSSLFFENNFVKPIGVALLAIMLFHIAKLHSVEAIGDYRRFLRWFPRAWLLLLLAVAFIDAISLLHRAPGHHAALGMRMLAMAVWFIAGGLALAGMRYALTMLFHYCVRSEIISHDVVVVGANNLAALFIRRVHADGLGVRVKAVFDENFGKATACAIADVPVRGGIDDLLVYNKGHDIANVVIALPLENNDHMRGLVRRLSLQPLKVGMLHGELAMEPSPNVCAPLGDVPGIHLMSIADLPLDIYGRLLKGVFDRVTALVALLFFAPAMVFCAIGIKLTSPGPIIFRQHRIGYRNRKFDVFKFRTMHSAACNTGKLTVRNDSRVFGFGALMRKLSLDELPQLFNVLIGDMSLVGPRPHMAEASAEGDLYFDIVQEYAARHRVKPGMTGLAQVNGWRGPTETRNQIEQRVALDLSYIDNWSFWLDIKILIKTCLVGFSGKNAF